MTRKSFFLFFAAALAPFVPKRLWSRPTKTYTVIPNGSNESQHHPENEHHEQLSVA